MFAERQAGLPVGSVDTLLRRAEEAARLGAGALAAAGTGAGAGAGAAATNSVTAAGCSGSGDAGRVAGRALPASPGGMGDTLARPLRPPLEQEAPMVGRRERGGEGSGRWGKR